MKISGKVTLWVILAAAMTTVMAGSLIAPVLNLMEKQLGISPTLARLIITTHGILIAVCSPLLGLLIDKVGMRRPLIFGLILYGLAGGSGLFITDYWLLIASRVLLGISIAAILTALTVAILNLYEGSRRNQVMGWRASSNSIGGVSFPLLGGFLGTFSWHWPFATYLVGLPLALSAFFAIPETHRGVVQSTSSSIIKRESTLGIYKRTPVVFLPYFLIFIGNILLYAIIVFLPKLLEQFGITNTFHIGVFVAATGLVGGTTSLMYGKIRARISYKAIVLIALALWAAGFTSISQAPSSLLLLFSIALFGIGLGIVMPTVPLWVGELVPASFRGRMTSYVSTFSFTGQFLSPIILSPIASSLGLNALFLAVGATSLLLFILFLVFFLRR